MAPPNSLSQANIGRSISQPLQSANLPSIQSIEVSALPVQESGLDNPNAIAKALHLSVLNQLSDPSSNSEKLPFRLLLTNAMQHPECSEELAANYCTALSLLFKTVTDTYSNEQNRIFLTPKYEEFLLKTADLILNDLLKNPKLCQNINTQLSELATDLTSYLINLQKGYNSSSLIFESSNVSLTTNALNLCLKAMNFSSYSKMLTANILSFSLALTKYVEKNYTVGRFIFVEDDTPAMSNFMSAACVLFKLNTHSQAGVSTFETQRYLLDKLCLALCDAYAANWDGVNCTKYGREIANEEADLIQFHLYQCLKVYCETGLTPSIEVLTELHRLLHNDENLKSIADKYSPNWLYQHLKANPEAHAKALESFIRPMAKGSHESPWCGYYDHSSVLALIEDQEAVHALVDVLNNRSPRVVGAVLGHLAKSIEEEQLGLAFELSEAYENAFKKLVDRRIRFNKLISMISCEKFQSLMRFSDANSLFKSIIYTLHSANQIDFISMLREQLHEDANQDTQNSKHAQELFLWLEKEHTD